jgi:hypothetical protein
MGDSSTSNLKQQNKREGGERQYIEETPSQEQQQKQLRPGEVNF